MTKSLGDEFVKTSNIINRTAEFVSPKHPDKICDQISDAILDAHLRQDPFARVAVDVAGGHGKLFITGEITSNAKVDVAAIAQEYVGENYDIVTSLAQQSPEISRGVDVGGAGDQGIMVGYACAETAELLPIEYVLARDLNRFLYEKHPFDGKTQISVGISYDSAGRYVGAEIRHVVISWQNVPTERLNSDLDEWLSLLSEPISIAPSLGRSINVAGDWSQGGFDADTGLTGRKIVIDNYGPRVPVGGGAFSGKDATKVDRSAAYAAREIAKDILRKRNAQEVLAYVAYALGAPQPVDVSAVVDGRHELIGDYDWRPQSIIERLKLREPNYAERAKWGHFSELS